MRHGVYWKMKFSFWWQTLKRKRQTYVQQWWLGWLSSQHVCQSLSSLIYRECLLRQTTHDAQWSARGNSTTQRRPTSRTSSWPQAAPTTTRNKMAALPVTSTSGNCSKRRTTITWQWPPTTDNCAATGSAAFRQQVTTRSHYIHYNALSVLSVNAPLMHNSDVTSFAQRTVVTYCMISEMTLD